MTLKLTQESGRRKGDDFLKQIIALGIIFAIILSGCAQLPIFEAKQPVNVEIDKSFSLHQNQTAIIKKNGAEIGRITLTELRQIGETCFLSNPPQCGGFASINSNGFEIQPTTFSFNSTANEKKGLGNYLIEFKFYSSGNLFAEIKSSGTGPVGIFIVTQTEAGANPNQIPLPSAGDSPDDQPPTLPF